MNTTATNHLEFLERLESETTDKRSAKKIRDYLVNINYWQPTPAQVPTPPIEFNDEDLIIHNEVMCMECGEILVSHHVHDYKTCSCPNQAMVDGGLTYCRFGAADMDQIQRRILTASAPHDVARKHATWGTRGKKGDEQLRYITIEDMTDEHIQAVLDTQHGMHKGLRLVMQREIAYRDEHSLVKPEVV